MEQFPNIRFIFNEKNGHLDKIALKEGVTPQEISALFNMLTLEGFSIRMKPHEFGLKEGYTNSRFRAGSLHVHIEKIQEPGSPEPDISYTLAIHAHALAKGKTDAERWKTYRNLFREFLDEDVAAIQIQGAKVPARRVRSELPPPPKMMKEIEADE